MDQLKLQHQINIIRRAIRKASPVRQMFLQDLLARKQRRLDALRTPKAASPSYEEALVALNK